MNEAVVGSGGPADDLGRIAWGGFSRVFLAGIVLVLAAIVVTMSGAGGLGGKLGALFGLHSGQGGKPVSAVQVDAPAPVLQPVVVARATLGRRARSVPGVRLRSRHPAATGPQRTQAPGTRPNAGPGQPAPPSLVQVPKPPPPAPSGNVQAAARTVHDTAPAAVPAPAQPVVQPAAQPVLDQTTAAVDQACGLIGGCP